jgi:hypothetical protein
MKPQWKRGSIRENDQDVTKLRASSLLSRVALTSSTGLSRPGGAVCMPSQECDEQT